MCGAFIRLFAATLVCAAIAMPTVALAQKKITYEEAFKRCKAFHGQGEGKSWSGYDLGCEQGDTRRGVHEEVRTQALTSCFSPSCRVANHTAGE